MLWKTKNPPPGCQRWVFEILGFKLPGPSSTADGALNNGDTHPHGEIAHGSVVDRADALDG